MRNAFEIKDNPGGAATSRWLGLVGLLLITAATWIGFDHLLPGRPLRNRSDFSRVGWYLRSGQWRADLRTLAAVVVYVVDQDKSAEPKNIAAATAPLPEPANHTAISVLKTAPKI